MSDEKTTENPVPPVNGTDANAAFPPPDAGDRAGRPGLSTDSPATGDADPQLAAALTRSRQKGKGPSKLTAGLAAAVLLVGGFFGGYAVKGATTDSTAAGRPAMAAGQGGPGGGGFPGGAGGTGGQGSGGTATFGTVKSIDGTTITLTTQNGETVQVDASGATIEVTSDGSVSDLSTGDTLVVQGTTGSGGEVTASRISEGAGAGPAGGPGGAGAGGSGSGDDGDDG